MNLKEICLQLVEVSRSTGKMLKNELGKFTMDRVETKGVHDFVSDVDKTAEKILVDQLRKILPEAGFITEENTASSKGERYNWVIDPLDGTTNFIHGIPLFSISLALLDKEEVVVGVVHEVNLDECFYAWKGSKAFLNSKELRVSEAQTIQDSLLATGFPYSDYSELKAYMGIFTHLLRNSHGIRRLGSAAVDLAYVACGRFEGFYEYGLNSWDVAAGILIVKQAGGSVTDFKGGRDYLFGRQILATNTHIHQEFIELTKKYFG